MVLGNFGIDNDAAVRHQSFECSLLVPTHQTRVPFHVGSENSCETTDG
jgi:hypothetical protein